jgi:hypothetical protein
MSLLPASGEFLLDFPFPRHLSLFGSYPLDLSGLGDPTGSSATAGLALRVTGTQKPLYHARWRYQQRGIYIGLCNCMLSKLKTNIILQCKMTHTFIRVLFGWELPASCEIWRSHQHYCLLVCDTMQSGKQHRFTQTFASISAEDEGSKIICNGACLQDCATANKTLILPHLLPQSEVIEVPDDSVDRQRPHGHSSSLGTAFCHCCLWTNTLF